MIAPSRLQGGLAAVLVMLAVASALAQTAPAGSWTEEKCHRYRQAWDDALKRQGLTGLSQEFLSAHGRFVAGGCDGTLRVCPRSPRETDLANIMTVRALNAGMASTFLPWGCP
jgi:hypothetical protein